MVKRILILLLLIVLINLVDAELESYLTLEWIYSTRAGITGIYIADLEGDGIMEIIAGSYDGYFYLIDEKGNLKFKYYAYCPIYSVNAADIDNDGIMEIIAGSCRPIHIVGPDGIVISKIVTQDAIKSMYIGDLDDDGYKDIMVASGSIRNHKVYIFDRNSRTLFQKGIQGAYPKVLAIDDLNNDRINEVIIGSTYLYVFDKKGDKKWTFHTEGEVSSLAINDLEGDGEKELIVGSYPNLYVLNVKGKLKWKYKTGGMVESVQITDLDDDGEPEIIAGSDRIYVFDKNGSLLWDYNPGSEVHKVDAGDLNMDGSKEVIAGSDKIHILSKEGILQLEYQPYRSVVDLEVVDLENDGKNELVIGCLDHNIYVLTSREIYLKKRQVDSLFNKAKDSYNSGDYENAKKHIEEAKNISERWNTGICSENPTMCDLLLMKINKKLEGENKTEPQINEEIEEENITQDVIQESVDDRTEVEAEPTEGYDNLLIILGIVIILIITVLLRKRIR